MALSKVHLIREGNVGPTKITTYCGLTGWRAKIGLNEYETIKGARFEAQPHTAGVSCGRCYKMINKNTKD